MNSYSARFLGLVNLGDLEIALFETFNKTICRIRSGINYINTRAWPVGWSDRVSPNACLAQVRTFAIERSATKVSSTGITCRHTWPTGRPIERVLFSAEVQSVYSDWAAKMSEGRGSISWTNWKTTLYFWYICWYIWSSLENKIQQSYQEVWQHFQHLSKLRMKAEARSVMPSYFIS